MNIISVRPTGRGKSYSIKHPLLKKVKKHTEKELKEIAATGDKDALCKALYPFIPYIVGRYLKKWPSTRPMEDDLVSEGFLAVVELVNGDLIYESKKRIISLACTRINDRVIKYLNDNRSLAAPSVRQQHYLKNKGKTPVYCESVGDGLKESNHPEIEGDEKSRDVLDAYIQLEPKDEIDAYLLAPENWGKKYRELSDELGVGVGLIHYRKARLYKQYLKITEAK